MKEEVKKAIFLLQHYAPPSEFTALAIESIKQLQKEKESAYREGYKQGQFDGEMNQLNT